MQVDELKNEGLSREYTVTVPLDEIDERINARLGELAGTIRVPGFRPGKVPMKVLRQRYSKAVMGEVLEKAVNETSQKVLEEREIRPAGQPRIEIQSFEEGADLVYTIGVDLMPEIEPMDFSQIGLTRYKARVDDAEVDQALERLAKDFRKTEPVAESRAAQEGDTVVIDFTGRIDGEEFEGGKGEDHHLELGAGRFIPGFEDQLAGVRTGETRTVKVTFPEQYGAAHLAGKEAEFEVAVKELREYVDTPIDDEFAKSLGLESLEQLKGHMRERLGSEYGEFSRNRLKRDLLDRLYEGHDFDVPPRMVESEFEQIWGQLEHAREHGEVDDEDKDKSDEELREEYRGIARRRVMLGVLLSEVARVNEIQVSQDEVNRAIVREAQKYPGQEREVMEFYQSNPDANASLRAPLMEDKVVDFILEMAEVEEKEVSVEELMRDPDDSEDTGAKPAKPARKAASRKSATKKAPAASKGDDKPAGSDDGAA